MGSSAAEAQPGAVWALADKARMLSIQVKSFFMQERVDKTFTNVLLFLSEQVDFGIKKEFISAIRYSKLQ
jgi:hypothetical protein